LKKWADFLENREAADAKILSDAVFHEQQGHSYQDHHDNVWD